MRKRARHRENERQKKEPKEWSGKKRSSARHNKKVNTQIVLYNATKISADREI